MTTTEAMQAAVEADRSRAELYADLTAARDKVAELTQFIQEHAFDQVNMMGAAECIGCGEEQGWIAHTGQHAPDCPLVALVGPVVKPVGE